MDLDNFMRKLSRKGYNAREGFFTLQDAKGI